MKKSVVVSGFVALMMVALPCVAVTISGGSAEHNASVMGSGFSEGWKAGYEAGWKQVKGQLTIAPIAPIPPIPPIGQNTYQGGYNNGFVAGMKAAQKK